MGMTAHLWALLACHNPPELTCAVEAQLPAPEPWSEQPGHLHPYIGQIGSWDGAGGELDGSSKVPALDQQVEAGLSWTFMPLHWSELEPDGPVDLSGPLPPEWEALDAFFLEAHARGLNVLVQAPVVGGNNGGPPDWVGAVEKGRSAPADMEAAFDFCGTLAQRYAPGGTLWQEQGVSDWGVQAWELDNEPGSYRTHWEQQEEDFGDFFAGCAQAIRGVDPDAQIVGPALAAGQGNTTWWEDVLASEAEPGLDLSVFSFHSYEGMDSIGPDRRSECVLWEQYGAYRSWAESAGVTPTTAAWHTEGGFDFLGRLGGTQRARWRMQWSVRLLGQGAHKITFKDPKDEELVVQALLSEHLADPWPLEDRTAELGLGELGGAWVHEEEGGGAVWVLWPTNGDPADQDIWLPVSASEVRVFDSTGETWTESAQDGEVLLKLRGSRRYSETLLVVDPGDD